MTFIIKSYESFIKRTQFTDNSPNFIKMEYETDCGGQFPTLRKRNYCNDVELGKTIDFYINITLSEFPSNKDFVIMQNDLEKEYDCFK